MAGKVSAKQTLSKASDFVRAEKNFLAIANATEDIIHLNDLDGRIVYANYATEKILGYRPDEIIDTYAHEIIHPDDRDNIKKDMGEVVTNGKVPPRTIRLRKKNGAYLDVVARGFQVVLENGKRYTGSIIRDISDGRKAGGILESFRDTLREIIENRPGRQEKTLAGAAPANDILHICSFCKNIRDEEGNWQNFEEFFRQRAAVEFSHGICDSCLKLHYPDFVPQEE